MSGSAHSKSAEAVVERGVLLFLIEGPAGDVRKALTDALKQGLQAQGVKAAPALLARVAGNASPASIVRIVVQALSDQKVDADALTTALSNAMNHALAKQAKLAEPLVKLLDAATRREMPCVALTLAPEADGRALLDRAGESRVQVHSFADDAQHGYPRADHWARVAKQLGKSTRGCVAVVDDGIACKTALAAGLKVIAVPTPQTAHQDFCGADVLLDAWDEMSPREMLDSAIPAK